MPRKSRKRGKEIKKRGISKEQICVATALDRQGNFIVQSNVAYAYTKIKDFKLSTPQFM